ncbi:MAG: hypothetical protein ABMA15_04860 [Vicinamibacterales bacterium]
MTRLYACVLVLGLASPAFADDVLPIAIVGHLRSPFVGPAMDLPSASNSLDPTDFVRTPRLAVSAQAIAQRESDRPHEIGLGGKAGGFTFGVGASARVWQSEKLGFQVDISHYGISSVGILQVAPSVLFVLGKPNLDKPTQIRPYAGGGVNFFRVSYSSFGSDTGIGGQGFVGAELVFEGAPKFGLSGDLGYYSTGDFFGVNVGGFALSLMGHYYIR